jgi:hypothetical protein
MRDNLCAMLILMLEVLCQVHISSRGVCGNYCLTVGRL